MGRILTTLLRLAVAWSDARATREPAEPAGEAGKHSEPAGRVPEAPRALSEALGEAERLRVLVPSLSEAEAEFVAGGSWEDYCSAEPERAEALQSEILLEDIHNRVASRLTADQGGDYGEWSAKVAGWLFGTDDADLRKFQALLDDEDSLEATEDYVFDWNEEHNHPLLYLTDTEILLWEDEALPASRKTALPAGKKGLMKQVVERQVKNV